VTSDGHEGSKTTTQEDTMQTDSYARSIAVDGAARPALLAQGFTG
jgi:hypothetical protein